MTGGRAGDMVLFEKMFFRCEVCTNVILILFNFENLKFSKILGGKESSANLCVSRDRIMTVSFQIRKNFEKTYQCMIVLIT